MDVLNINSSIHLFQGDSIDFYDRWEVPTVIVSDGPYGINGYKGDLKTPIGLDEWYEPHIEAWSRKATAQTTLWFWNTELGWATVHPILLKHGWEFKTCNVWDKGMSHVAGNTNTKTISHLPVVSEVCVQYVKKPSFDVNGRAMSMKDWLRYEWERTGLPFSKTNDACGVVNAATRKYFTKCHLWYMPPADMFCRISDFANTYGKPDGKPYFSIDGKKPISKEEWDTMRPKFYCPFGVTNVWTTAQLRGTERIKNGLKAVHLNQKPLGLIQRIIEMSSDAGDVVWDPFGGLFTSALSCMNTKRICYSSEITPEVYESGVKRLKVSQQTLQF
ncbi:DNA methyltransferase [uncultured Muribaculum sp.]|uniref:DNA methyltransferase n=1 Tax=uncultured Muribaculum sp. TaxID=1918613 RepID=UPI0025D5A61F|nr:DNA methyltransferase [uncultured Muribaculum sp.]